MHSESSSLYTTLHGSSVPWDINPSLFTLAHKVMGKQDLPPCPQLLKFIEFPHPCRSELLFLWGITLQVQLWVQT